MSASDKRLPLGLALATASCLALAGMGQTTLPVNVTQGSPRSGLTMSARPWSTFR